MESPSPDLCIGRSGLLGAAVGIAVGFAVVLSQSALSQLGVALPQSVLSQFLVSLALSVLLALSNFVPFDARGIPVLAFACGCLGLFLGYSVGAACEIIVERMQTDPVTTAGLHIPLFLTLVMLFHLAEFAFVVFFHPQDTKFQSLMLAPVPGGAYSIALIAAIVEYWAELGFWTGMPAVGAFRSVLVGLGFLLGLAGWGLRAAALFTAKSNFTHLVAQQKQAGHVLVVTGVYAFCRHPGYVGWFLWSVSTQLTLGNPICFVAYTYVSWRFFADRIPVEEDLLVDFFGEDYLSYAHRVPCGLPWISLLEP